MCERNVTLSVSLELPKDSQALYVPEYGLWARMKNGACECAPAFEDGTLPEDDDFQAYYDEGDGEFSLEETLKVIKFAWDLAGSPI